MPTTINQLKENRKKKLAQEFDAWLSKEGFTTESFARGLNIPSATVSKWRQGEVNPNHVSHELLRERYPNCPLLR